LGLCLFDPLRLHPPALTSPSFTTEQGTPAVDEVVSNVPSNFELSQNYPNPFNPLTTIQFSLSKSSHVKILIYSTLVHLVQTLVEEALPRGTYRKQWVATCMVSGINFHRIQAGGFVETKRFVLIEIDSSPSTSLNNPARPTGLNFPFFATPEEPLSGNPLPGGCWRLRDASLVPIASTGAFHHFPNLEQTTRSGV
jgi:hypothetical protein